MAPVGMTHNGKDYYAAMDFTLESEDWGEGSAMGLLKLHSDSNYMRRELKIIATFPRSHFST